MTPEQQQRYNERMKRKKAVVDAKIAKATEERGVLILLRGNGKGKSSSALGTMARAVGHGQKVAVLQFIKGRLETGEYKFFRDHPQIDWHVMGHGFTWETQDFQRDVDAAEQAWTLAAQLLNDPTYDMLIFDEMAYPFKYKHLAVEPVVAALQQRPLAQTVIITGRVMPAELIDIADTITDMKDERHAFRSGVKAQAGIEF